MLNLMNRENAKEKLSFIEYLGEILYRFFKRVGELLVKTIKRIIKEVWDNV